MNISEKLVWGKEAVDPKYTVLNQFLSTIDFLGCFWTFLGICGSGDSLGYLALSRSSVSQSEC